MDEYIKLMREKWSVYKLILGLKDSEKRILKRINRIYGKEGINYLSKFIDFKNKKVLDVGSGCGEFIFEAHLNGAIVYGIEPDDLSIKISKLLFNKENKKATIKKGYGEKIPFKDNYFDLIISNSTIEHVNNPKNTLDEMFRVLKKDGMLWLKCPNFIYPFERHYKKFYFPFLSKKMNQKYFNLITGIKSDYFLHLNRINPYFLIDYFKKNNLKFENLSLKKSKNIFNKILYKFHFYPQIEFIVKK